MLAPSDRETRYMRENLLAIGLDWERYAKLHPHPCSLVRWTLVYLMKDLSRIPFRVPFHSLIGKPSLQTISPRMSCPRAHSQ